MNQDIFTVILIVIIFCFLIKVVHSNLYSNFSMMPLHQNKPFDTRDGPNTKDYKNISSNLDLIQELDKQVESNIYGNDVFYRNIYYRDNTDLRKFISINGLNNISPELYIRNVPINDMYKKNKRGQFFILQPNNAKT